MSNLMLYGLAVGALFLSFIKDRAKTKSALIKAWKALENILPQFLGVIMVIGIILSFFEPTLISKIIGSQSGWLGATFAAVAGAITLIPGFIAFPIADLLLQSGAGYMQIGAFISSLMMVGVVTLPIEYKYFGKKTAHLRNASAFIFSFIVAFIIGKVVG